MGIFFILILIQGVVKMTIYNFSAGPATMPAEVIQEIKNDLPSYKNSGMSVMEISH